MSVYLVAGIKRERQRLHHLIAQAETVDDAPEAIVSLLRSAEQELQLAAAQLLALMELERLA